MLSQLLLSDYTLSCKLMGSLLVTNYISVRHYVLAVENLLPRTNGLTRLPYFSATARKGSVVSVMVSSNFSFYVFMNLTSYGIIVIAIMMILLP